MRKRSWSLEKPTAVNEIVRITLTILNSDVCSSNDSNQYVMNLSGKSIEDKKGRSDIGANMQTVEEGKPNQCEDHESKYK
mmetsp:Transcript_102390/g.187615  ORF Transcript_102390/g.187615 Transcript_102390/m.187615 type:complete len:80 (+) Transcript_102390:408-647(+)